MKFALKVNYTFRAQALNFNRLFVNLEVLGEDRNRPRRACFRNVRKLNIYFSSVEIGSLVLNYFN
jgi:hypothetical protein